MKTTFSVLALSLFASSQVSAELECELQISRGFDSPAACAHFEGIGAEPYRNWYDDNGIASKYPGNVYIQGSDPNQPENGAAIHWNVDGDYVFLAIAVRATGWLGFGIAEAGGMLGTDMVLFEAAKPQEIVDAYTTDMRFPVKDDCPSDWELVASNVDEDGGFIMIELKRLLNTNDPQDHAIFNDASTLIPPTRVIAAWGDSSEVSYHGLNRARGAVRFFGVGDDSATFAKVMATNADGSFVISSVDHEIAAEETEYAYNCFSRDDLIAQGVLNTTDLLNIIGFEPIIQEGHEAYVHHYIIYGSSQPECTEDGFNELVYVWAPGEGAVALPDNLGSPLFGEAFFGAGGFQAFKIEVHYNNPQLTTGIVDNSGVRVFWTSQPRDEQIGILATGDPQIGLYGEAVGDGLSSHSFECPGTCSGVAGKPVTVLREYLHMHATGARIVNEQIRDGEVVRKASVEYWEFDQNGNAAVQQDSFDIQPGDGFRTTCYYSGNGRVFGLGSAEEMCMAFLYYYPRVLLRIEELDLELPWYCGYNLGLPPCETTYEKQMLTGIDDLEREFGVVSEGCDKPDDNTPPGNDPESGAALVHSSILALFFAAALAF